MGNKMRNKSSFIHRKQDTEKGNDMGKEIALLNVKSVYF